MTRRRFVLLWAIPAVTVAIAGVAVTAAPDPDPCNWFFNLTPNAAPEHLLGDCPLDGDAQAVGASPSAPPSRTHGSAASMPTQKDSEDRVLDLPQVRWEGGPRYWTQFARADAAGWGDPSFFPISIWYGSPGDPAQVHFDKAYGINIYAQANPDTPYAHLRDAGMFSLSKMNDMPGDSAQYVGALLDDEVDGRYSEADGRARLQSLSDEHQPPTTGRFRYVNHTSGILTYDRSVALSSGYINAYSDVTSVDQYFYSVPQCDWGDERLRWRTPEGRARITTQNCRTSSAYGKMIDLQREIDRLDGNLQPIWAVQEVISPGGSSNGYRQPAPEQIKGGVMNSLIHEARGIVWFSQSPDQLQANDCPSSDAFRDARLLGPSWCGYANVEAVQQVNALVHSLAKVLNTQSHHWRFGADLETMLKVHDGHAYIFAMAAEGGSGLRTFTLPDAIRSPSVEVLHEDRSLSITDGRFSDDFAAEYIYHVYRIPLS